MNENIPDEINLMDYFQVIRKRKWLVILGTLVCMVVAGAVSLTMPKVYEATVFLMATKSRYQVDFASEKGKIATPLIDNITTETFNKLIVSPEIAAIVIKKLDLDKPPFNFKIHNIQGKIKTEAIKNTNLIAIKVQDTEPKRVPQIANTWAETFIEKNENLTSQETSDTYEFVSDQLEKAKTTLSKHENELKRFQEIHRIGILDKEINARTDKLVSSELRFSDIMNQIPVERARLDRVLEWNKEQERTLLSNDLSQVMRGMTNAQALLFLKERLKEWKKNLDESEERIKQFKERSKMPVLQKQIEDKIAKIAGFEIRLADIKLSLEKEEANIKLNLSKIMEREISFYQTRLAEIKFSSAQNVKDYQQTESEREKHPVTLTKEGLFYPPNPTYVNLSQRLSDLLISRNNLLNESNLLEEGISKLKKMSEDIERSADKKNSIDELLEYTNGILSKIKEIQVGSLKDEKSKALEKSIVESILSIHSMKEETRRIQKNLDLYNQHLDNLRTELEKERIIDLNLNREYSLVKDSYSVLASKEDQLRIATSSGSTSEQLVREVTREKTPLELDIKQNLINTTISLVTLETEAQRLKEYVIRLKEDINRMKVELAAEQLKNTQLTRAVDTAKITYDILSKKLEETKISTFVRKGNIQIVTRAVQPESPIGPKKRQNVMIAGVVGLLASIMLAFFIEFLEKNKAALAKPN